MQTNSSRYDKLLQRLRDGNQVMIDGGTGTEVERRGVPQLKNAWNAGGALSHPEILKAIHADYIHHGAEIIISNTFATSRNLLQDAGVPELFSDYNRRGVEIACEARNDAGLDDVLVAGSISHWSFSGRLPSIEDLREGAAEQAKIMRDAGADLIMLEMMIETPRMLAVLAGAKESGLPVWVGVSCAPDTEGTMCLQVGKADENGVVQSGTSETLAEAISAINDKEVVLLSIMHTDINHIEQCLNVVEANWNGLVGLYAHSGHYVNGNWIFQDTISPEDFAAASRQWLSRNVQVIGGCCGIRPDHIALLREQVYVASS